MTTELTEKIIFAGSMGSGKSTAIRAISEIVPVSTDVKNNDTDQNDKVMTTMAMDYGTLTLSDGSKLLLYGTPGQERLSFMWSIIAKDSIGVVFLIANDQADPLANLDVYLDGFADLIQLESAVIGITRSDIDNKTSVTDYQNHLQSRGLSLPVFIVDIRDKNDVLLLLDGLLSICEAQYS
jgi:signal recognition particle receptor subunit beta